jgi:hypothetical protein
VPASLIAAATAEAHCALAADSVGAFVPRNAGGSVHSVFRRACNIETRDGGLVTLLAPELGNLPRGIRCTLPGDLLAARLRAGQHAMIEDAALHVPAARLRVDFSRAPVWCCEPATIDVRNAATGEALHRLRALLARHTPAAGFAPLLFGTGGARTAWDRAVGARLGETLPRLTSALLEQDAGRFAAALARLIGAGVGLTPSGDDFIVGLLAALWSRTGTEAAIAALLDELVSPFARLASRTDVVSRQQLDDAVHGRFAQRLIDVLRALAQQRDATGPVELALASGHSSGADTLSGLWFGLSLPPIPVRRSRPSFDSPVVPAAAAA